MTHRIHLKGPWEFLPIEPELTANQSLPAGGTAKFPATWGVLLGSFRGRVRFSRPFNCPTNLEAADQVHLVLDGVGGSGEVRLNQRLAGVIHLSQISARFEITPLLQRHNRLEIDLSWHGSDTGQGGLWGPVALEIIPGANSEG